MVFNPVVASDGGMEVVDVTIEATQQGMLSVSYCDGSGTLAYAYGGQIVSAVKGSILSASHMGESGGSNDYMSVGCSGSISQLGSTANGSSYFFSINGPGSIY